MTARIYIEGGGDTAFLRADCRENFSRLLAKCGFTQRMPRLVACGTRNDTFKQFKKASTTPSAAFIAMLVDSEDPVADLNKTWEHLAHRDGWPKPKYADDEQVFFMTTCMETWIVADPATLKTYFGHGLQPQKLPALNNLEFRQREDVQKALKQATRNCSNRYEKGRRSFEIIGKLNPDAIEHLPSFARMKSILDRRFSR